MKRFQGCAPARGDRPVRGRGRRPIYYFDVVHDYPSIGGVVEFSRLLFRELKRRYGRRLVSAREAAAALGGPDASMGYLPRERQIAALLAAHDPDSTFFFPNFQSPVVRAPDGTGPRIVNVVHDVQFAFLPELFRADRLRDLHRIFAETRENADHVVFISRTAQDQYLRLFGAPHRHEVIYDPVEIGPGAAGPPDEAPFLLSSVHHHPHKNFAGLLALFAAVAERMPALTLVVTGYGGERFAKDLAALPEALRARIRHLGYVPRAELDGLYRRAQAFLTLSRFEGFNMSAAEAASHGTPLILSDLPVHRELFADRACFVDPLAPSAEAVTAFLEGGAGRAAGDWPLRAACAPSAVAAAYARVIDACEATRPEARRRPAALPAWPDAALTGLRFRSLSAGARTLLTTTILAGAIPLLAPVHAHADGGAGGGFENPALGGTGYGGEDGQDGGSAYYGGGGGGAGGGDGGTGGPTLCSVPVGGSQCDYAGGGGEGGTSGNPDGGEGGDGTQAGGTGGGGGGGYHGNGFTGTLPGTDLTGGAGGAGGAGIAAGIVFPGPASGGGGGAGGYGALVTLTGNVTNAATITGGAGGAGGAAPGFSGGGGDGGVGLYFTQTGVTFTNTGAIDGGAGGSPGPRGASGATTGVAVGAPGDGGAGIVGAGLTVVMDGGTATGGLSGDGLVRADAITFTGGANILRFTGYASGLTGSIGIVDGSLTLDQSGVATLIDSAITGAGALFKTGDAVITLSGISAYTGATEVTGGKLVVNGSIAASSGLTLGSGTMLGGTGILPSTTILAGAVHAPGNSIGTETVAGDYTLQGTLAVEISPTVADRVAVAGAVDISGAALEIVPISPPGQSWGFVNGPIVIIENDGGDAVTGQFASVSSPLIFLRPELAYDGGDGNDLTLALDLVEGGFASVAGTGNQAAAAGGVESLGPGNPLWNALILMTDADDARRAFDLLSGDGLASGLSAAMEDSRFLRAAAVGRMREARGGDASDVPAAWTSGYGSWGTFEGQGEAGDLERATGGIFFGVDVPVADGVRLGALAGYGRSSFSVDDRGTSGSGDRYDLALYGGGRWGALGVRAGAGYSWHDISSRRSFGFAGLSDTLTADWQARTLQIFGDVGYAIEAGPVGIEPFAGLAYVSVDADDLSEEGGVAALSGTPGSMETSFLTTGLRFSATFLLEGAAVTAGATAGWRHAFGDTAPEASFAFAGGDRFGVTGVPIDEDAAIVELGLGVAVDAGLAVGVSYSGQFGDETSDQGLRATASWRF
jgi:outer membrane autotransporter protein